MILERELVFKKKVDACLSDDTDMFVYGCPKVLRNINLSNHTVVLYNRNIILKELDLSLNDFNFEYPNIRIEIIALFNEDYFKLSIGKKRHIKIKIN